MKTIYLILFLVIGLAFVAHAHAHEPMKPAVTPAPQVIQHDVVKRDRGAEHRAEIRGALGAAALVGVSWCIADCGSKNYWKWSSWVSKPQ